MCGECGGVLGINNGHLARWWIGLSGQATACKLCPECYSRFKERGTGGIPNAAAQAYESFAIARNARRW
jgi:hypothetical protein